MPGVKDAMTLQIHSQAASSSLSWKTDATGLRSDGEDKEKMPAVDAKTTMRHYFGIEQLELQRKDMTISAVMKDGLIDDWESLERLWSHTLLHEMRIDPRQHPVLLTEPTHNTDGIRERMMQTMFEMHQVPSLFIAKNAVLTSFASGRTTSLVLKSGGGHTVAVPVSDGFCLRKHAVTSKVDGGVMSRLLLNALKGIESSGSAVLRPRTSLTMKNDEIFDLDINSFHDSYRNFWFNELAHDLKVACCKVSVDPQAPGTEAGSFQLPDGNTIEIPASIGYEIQEQMFAPSRLLIAGAGAITAAPMPGSPAVKKNGDVPDTEPLPAAGAKDETGASQTGSSGAATSGGAAAGSASTTSASSAAKLSASTPVKLSPAKRSKLPPIALNDIALLGLGNIVCSCIAKCEVELKKELYGNVIVTGGNTLFPGFVDRLHNEIYYELDRMQPNLGKKLRIIAPQTPKEQHFRYQMSPL
eukprot:SAG31_NODE_1878_length_7006_cov_19.371652_4_plen_470_part_00